MNFDFSEEQKAIQEQARKLLDEQCGSAVVRSIMEQPEKPYAAELWQQIAEMGWMGTAIPERYGGLGLGSLELCVLAEELGRRVAPLPFSSTIYLFTEALLLAGSEAQKSHYLPKIAAGELIGCVALAEQPGDVFAASIASQYQDGALTGCKLAVEDADVADVALVLALDESGCQRWYLLELEQAAVSRQSVDCIDLARSCAELSFRAAAAEPLGEPAELASAATVDSAADKNAAAALLDKLYDRAAVLFAFEQVGGCEAVIDMAREYTMQRYAFGRPVASFQAIKHRIADMFVAKELAKSNAYYAAWALSTDAAELPLAAATARVSAIAAYEECSRENIQVHGGMGFTWELDCHLYYRRAQLLSMTLGSGQHWRQRAAQRLLAGDAAASRASS